ncbi:hypothetical protein HDU92_009176, partial [Lobulomyces angularis]
MQQEFPGKQIKFPFYSDVKLETGKKIFKRLLEGVSIHDKKGWIYSFYKKIDGTWQEQSLKIGRTDNSVEKRLRQWTNQCGEELKIKKSWETKWNHLTETLVHLELKDRGLWLGNINGGGKCNYEIQKEWFSASVFHEIDNVVSYWVRYVDALESYYYQE